MPIETLRIFQTDDELEQLICGVHNNDSEWKNIAKLSEVIVSAHGYHQKSK